MADLIDRQAAINALVEELAYKPEGYWDSGLNQYDVEVVLNQQPSAQPTQFNTPNTLEALDCISRQAAIDAVQKHREGVLGGYEYDEGVAFVYAAAHRHIAEVLEKMPSADVQPVRHGHWIYIGTEENGNAFYSCSVCGKGEIHVPIVEVAYCWNCGAKMDEGSN